jgi:hypothetical protein
MIWRFKRHHYISYQTSRHWAQVLTVRFCSSNGNDKMIEYPTPMQATIPAYEVRPRKDKRGVSPVRCHSVGRHMTTKA